jgi:hypothetical protein
MKILTAILLVICSITGLHAQVDEIKSASESNSSNGSKSSGGSSDDSDGDGSGFLAIFDFVGMMQSFKLQKDRALYPSMVSFDVAFQGGVKPSSYYMLWPRVRGNWGMFSTDFRMNYLIEEDIEGYKHIRTNDWQVIQLNLVTSRYFTFRLGAGYMEEAFGDERSFFESAFMAGVHAPDQTKTLGFEYRFTKDWDTGANPRREFTIQYQQQIFNTGSLHGYITAGGVYQRYYNSITVWGVMTGLVFRLF